MEPCSLIAPLKGKYDKLFVWNALVRMWLDLNFNPACVAYALNTLACAGWIYFVTTCAVFSAPVALLSQIIT